MAHAHEHGPDGKHVHLHVHTDYSMLDGAARVEELLSYAAELGQKSMAITDQP